VPANPNDFEGEFLGPDDEPPNRPQSKNRKRAERLRPLPGAYVRVPIQWLCKPVREHVFPPEARLFLYVLYRSHWGQREVLVTDKVAAEVGVEPRQKRRHLLQLQREGWIRIERRTPHGAPVVCPIVIAG
jgi:hypothetical protein